MVDYIEVIEIDKDYHAVTSVQIMSEKEYLERNEKKEFEDESGYMYFVKVHHT